MGDKFLEYIKDEPIEQKRYISLKEMLSALSNYFMNCKILDFGASYGLSSCALIELGAKSVIGIEQNEQRVKRGREILKNIGYDSKSSIHHIQDTRNLPFEDGTFDVVLVNAVLEHIPPPRLSYIREIWRVLAVNGYLIINETPNKYIPMDFHTTGLLLVPWLPFKIAHRYAIWKGRFAKDADWKSSGWRGIGYYEITKGLYPSFQYIPELTRFRQRLLLWLGLPACLLDPYPSLIFRKLD